MVMSVLEEVADLLPHPLSPLPESPPPILSSPSSDVEADAVIDALPPPPSPAVESTQPEVVSDKLNQKAKHPKLSACACKDKCFTKIDQMRRERVNSEYWDRTYNERKGWIFNHSSITSPKTPVANRKRREYFLTNQSGVQIKVCVAFFLRTLGYSSNSVFKCLEKSSPSENSFVRPDRRGKHKPAHAFSDEVLKVINEHIESFHPTCSHYRRSHAPLKRHLPPDVTVCYMHSHFEEKHPDLQVGYDSYRKRVVARGISFARLGVEECEQCMAFKLHEHSQPEKTQTATHAQFNCSIKQTTPAVVSTTRRMQRKTPKREQRSMLLQTCRR
ncbi:CAI-1 autoinducer sensor kinase/phosphatase CqsS [Elysia marginata]|uniref:CAI-1 autoinducer sensor kinase/phosphatase CqsS n=1 Tax=Elysia marginata TaxID=1093978 RepID=A0AAV4EYG0_9GAST|nr:CAI-1 autoinducer sensor kinase/phosphatase CqsS [Elysia marginata]